MTKQVSYRERILEYAKEKFFKHGFKKVTMDELAAKMHMSKKTIYKLFPSKRILIASVIERQIDEVTKSYNEIIQSQSDYIERLYKLWMLIGKNYVVFGKTYHEELRTYDYMLWKQVEKIRKTVFDNFLSFLSEGIFTRVIRSDICKEVILPSYIGALRGVIHESDMAQYSFSVHEVLSTISTMIFEGMLSDTGKRQFGLFNKNLSNAST